MKGLNWGTIIPLIGGSAIGCFEATGTLPKFHLSFDGFQTNDYGIVNYWKDVPYYNLDHDTVNSSFEGIDFVNSVCPCAALCRLNTSAGKMHGADAPQNNWMYKSAEYVLNTIKPKVYWGENAPALAGENGKPVVKKLIEISNKYGYSFSVYKTSTIKHGLPQKRDRCFYFFWKGDKIPVLGYFDRERPLLKDYLLNIDKDTPNFEDHFIKEKPTDFLPFRFLLEKENLSYSEFIHKYGQDTIQSIMGIIFKNGLIDELVSWTEKYHKDDIMTQKTGRTFYDYILYAKEKYDNGKGLFKMGPVFCENYSPAVISKTCYSFIHPTEDRYLSYREYMKLMGMPDDFIPNDNNDNLVPVGMIGQNVPVNTVYDMCWEVLRFINDDETLEYITNDGSFLYLLQNNLNQKYFRIAA